MRTIAEYDRIPKYFGVAWRNPDTRTLVTMIWPVNIMCGFVRKLWLGVRYFTISESNIDLLKLRAYDKGYEDGAQSERMRWSSKIASMIRKG